MSEEQNLGRELSEVKTELREYRTQNADRINRFEASTGERFTRLEGAIKNIDDKIERSIASMEKMETDSLIDVGIQQNIDRQKKEAERKRQMYGWYAAGFVGFIEIVHTFWDGIVRAVRHVFGP